jgi:GNAT superfamily N-acetyltransferase
MTQVIVSAPTPRADPDPALADALARVHVDGWREAYGHLLPERFYGEEAFASRRTMWRSVLAHEGVAARLRIAWDTDSAVVGFALTGPSRDADLDCRELYALYIRASHYGTGTGQALIDAALGRQPASLWVAEDNPRALRFYEKNGFARDGKRTIDEDANGLAEIRMRR